MFSAGTQLHEVGVEIEPSGLIVSTGLEDRRIELAKATFHIEDARLFGRFVRHLQINTVDQELHFVTPPFRGSIAPRAARLPNVLDSAWVIGTVEMGILHHWFSGRRKLSGHTIEELANIATLASSRYAVEIGEKIAQLATDMMSLTKSSLGPMRGTGKLELQRLLKPLEEIASTSTRASEALIAALSRAAVAA